MFIVFFLIIFSCIMLIISCNDDLFMDHKKLQTFFSGGAFLIAIIALIIAIFQLGGMNESLDSSDDSLNIMKKQLDLQISESKNTTKLLNQTLWENRKMDFDKHTFGALYIWDNHSTDDFNNKQINWTENVTLYFSNNFSYTVFEEIDVTIEFSEGNYTNYSYYPIIGVDDIQNGSIEPPFNLTRIVWGSIGAKENVTISFMLNWSREKYNQPIVYPLNIRIIVKVRGDIYSIKNNELPVYHQRY